MRGEEEAHALQDVADMADMAQEGAKERPEEDRIEPPATKEEQDDDTGADDVDPMLGDDLPESTWKSLRKRRLFPGAMTSNEDFDDHVKVLSHVNASFQERSGEPTSNSDTILRVVHQHQQSIKAHYPRFSKHMVRVATAAVAIFCTRTSDMSMREHALMLWIVEGADFLRFHDGDCYMLHGAFQRYKGVPTDSSRLCNFLLQLEGLFRRLPADTPREQPSLLQAINQQWQAAGEDDEVFGQRCIRSAVSNIGEPLAKPSGVEDGVDMDADVQNWRFHVARVVLQL